MNNEPCAPGAHVHTAAGCFLFRGYAVMIDDHAVLVRDRIVADRIAELVNRHGFLDIPDTLANTWPAPDPHDRIIDLVPPTIERAS